MGTVNNVHAWVTATRIHWLLDNSVSPMWRKIPLPSQPRTGIIISVCAGANKRTLQSLCKKEGGKMTEKKAQYFIKKIKIILEKAKNTLNKT